MDVLGVHAICVPRVLVGSAFAGPSTVLVCDGRVLAVLEGSTPPPDTTSVVHLDDGFLTAGLVDLQVNGCYGIDFAAASPQDWQEISRRLLSTGVTAYVPTYVTAPVAELAESLDRTSAAMIAQARHGEPVARILGAHLEGPFISPARAGAHDPELMLDPDEDSLGILLGSPARARALRVLTLAPERRYAIEAIRRLTAAGVVVSIGHTDADGPCAHAAADTGARLVTHVFNAMRPLSHRDASLPAAVLVDDRFHLGLIADLAHVDPDVVRLVLRVAPDRTVLVTDAVAAAGAPAGTYVLGGVEVSTTEADPLPRRADGVLAGSVLTLDQAVRNVAGLGIALEHALLAATRNPADVLARPDLGRIAPGAAADLVWWSDDLTVRRTWVSGHQRRGH